ncbi:MAG: hypothetical protein NTV46_04670 [Verrucomicrobia bacterium]|nr:hypothetical protein [Verrucomicrobiota bacterium]
MLEEPQQPPMNELPPSIRDPRKKDADHLKLLAVFHYVVAGFAFLGIGFLLLHYTMMNHIMFNPRMWENQKGGPPPQEFFAFFKWFYLIFGALLILGSVCNLLSGLWINARRNRMFSLVVAGINCFQVPLGTALGVFTIIVLMRDSVRDLYEARQGDDPNAGFR